MPGKPKHYINGVPLTKHWLYKRVSNVFARCNNKSRKDYHRYGGRGIRCLFDSHKEFIEYLITLENCNKSMQMDRIDNDKNYERGNLRFVEPRENANNRSNNISVDINGETVSANNLSELTGISQSVIKSRISRGLALSAVVAPVYRAERYSISGKSKTVSEWADEIGISESSFRKRLRKWPLERALTEPPPRPKEFEYMGVSMSIPEWARKSGINQSTLYYRVVKYKMDLKDALEDHNQTLLAREAYK